MYRGPKKPSVKASGFQPHAAQELWDLEAERELWADICRANFWWFLKIAWGADSYMESNPNDRWLTARVHRPICNWLQRRVEEWEQRRAEGSKTRTKIALIIPRFFGKTVMGTKALSLWAHVRNPDISTFIGSETVGKAIEFLEPVKTILEGKDANAWFSWLYGNWFSPERIWTRTKVVHAARQSLSRSEASFDTWGVEQGITGAHPDWGVFDDPLTEEKIKESGSWITTVNQSMAALRPAFRTDSFFMIALTRYRDNDVAGTYLKLEGVRSWSGFACPDEDGRFKPREDGEWDVYFLQAYDKHGDATLPEVYPKSELQKYERTNPVQFSAQMMNEPGSGEHMELTSEQIADMWIERKDLPMQLSLTLHLDTAFKEDKTRGSGDESVWELWGHDPKGTGDVYYLEGYGSDTDRIEQFTDSIIQLAQRLKGRGKRIRLITDDKETGGKAGTWVNWLRSSFHGAGLVMPPFLPLARQGTRKIIRMREAAGFWVDGHVKLVKDAPGVEKLVHQMVKLGVASNDDWADAAADVFASEVYRPMLNPASRGDNDSGAIPRQPGDDILGRWKSNDDARRVYDKHLKGWVEKVFQRDDYQ